MFRKVFIPRVKLHISLTKVLVIEAFYVIVTKHSLTCGQLPAFVVSLMGVH